MREAAGDGRVEADEIHHLLDPGTALGLRDAVGSQALGDRIGDGGPRVERRVRVLEHDLDVLAQRTQLGRAGAEQVLPGEAERALVGIEQSEQDARQRGLAAARLADEAEHLALVDLEIDVVDGANRAADAPERTAAQRERLHDARVPRRARS